ncbi:MAG: peptidoglycan DD-metalloendopeptidase family protein [Bacteroidales bacterium]|nr:peptidoglycan DD-metalloendopeptidase family protein [Bacteroidales bacterium]
MKKYSFLLVVCSLLLFCSCNENAQSGQGQNDTADTVETDRMLYNIRVNGLDVVVDTVKKGENITMLFLNSGVDLKTCNSLLAQSDSIYNIKHKLKLRPYTRIFSDSTLKYLIYEYSDENYLVYDLSDSIPRAYKGQKEITYKERKAKGTIETSLWNAMVDNGLSPNLAMTLSDVYAWSIDFFGLQKGDYFKVVYVEKYIDSIPSGIEDIKYAVFNHLGQDCYAIPFEQDGYRQYFDQDGKSTRKVFLKAPLKYSRISSYFSNARKHPVLKIVRPHHGVDYAAPTGTPVHTIGDGVVVKKCYSGGAGNMITIKHAHSYTTSYMHLSKFAKGVNVGSRVRQGQVIGYVGSTGLATGPHLDFRVYKNGTPINPLKMISPPTNPVKESDMPAFRAVADSLISILSSF